MTSKSMRDNPLFMRNNFDSVGKWGIPLIKKQELSRKKMFSRKIVFILSA